MKVATPPQKRLYMVNMAYMGMANMTTTARWLDFKMTGKRDKWLKVQMAGYFDVQMAKWLDGKQLDCYMANLWLNGCMSRWLDVLMFRWPNGQIAGLLDGYMAR